MTVQTPISLDDYDAIASAVMETERGRWFLAEFARRNRAADTAAVLAALGDLERKLSDGRVEAPALTPPADAARASQLVRRIAERASLLRNELNRPADAQARITRAHSHIDKLDRLITLALTAVGAAPRTQKEIHARAPLETSTLPAPIDVVSEPSGSEEEAPPALALSAPQAPEIAAEGPVEPVDPIENLAVLVNGHVIDLLGEDDEREEAVDPLAPQADASQWDATPVFRTSPEANETEPRDYEQAPAGGAKVRMPAAEAPLLLDSLSAETKAILFA